MVNGSCKPSVQSLITASNVPKHRHSSYLNSTTSQGHTHNTHTHTHTQYSVSQRQFTVPGNLAQALSQHYWVLQQHTLLHGFLLFN